MQLSKINIWLPFPPNGAPATVALALITPNKVTMEEALSPNNQWRNPLQPSYELTPVFIRHLKVMVNVGTFISMKPNPPVNHPINLGRVMKWFQRDDGTKVIVANLHEVDPPDHANSDKVLSRHMAKVSQLPKCVEVMETDVIDIRFVFIRDDVDSLNYVAQGRNDSFILKSKPFPNQDFYAFPCFSPRSEVSVCLGYRLWMQMDRMCLAIHKPLCSTAQAQGTFCRRPVTIRISQETWEYFLRQANHESLEDVGGCS